ncbi:MAG: TRAP transporter large permease [Eubacteriales bacterium]|nr:TRAP transporter large permease [Eubacteriales bacterium]
MPAILILLVFVAGLLISIPISSVIGLVSVMPSVFDSTFQASVTYVIQAMVSGVNSFPLLAIPMFILSGIIMARGGVSKKLFDVFAFFLGKLPGGMPCAVIITCLFYGAISGSAPATVAAVGSMTIPVLLNLGYKKEFAAATVVVAGGLGVIIPPSIPMVLYGMASGASVGDMFTAGIVPGLMIAGILMLYAITYSIRKGEDREKINQEIGSLRAKGFVQIFKEGFWALLSPVIILGSIYGGIASPTEAAVISVFYALFISICLYRTLKPSDIPAILRETVKTYAPLLFILATASAMAKIMALMRIPDMISEAVTGTFTTKIAILLVINAILLLVGMVMDTSPAILLLTPILLPIVQLVGMDEIHFGIMMIVNLAIGFVTPPMGVNLFVASSLTKIPLMRLAKFAVPYVVLFLVALALLAVFPQISLCLL